MAFCSKLECFHLYNFIPTSWLVPAAQLGEGWLQLSLWRFFLHLGHWNGRRFWEKGRAGGCQPYLLPSCSLSAHPREVQTQATTVPNTKRNNQKLKQSFRQRTSNEEHFSHLCISGTAGPCCLSPLVYPFQCVSHGLDGGCTCFCFNEIMVEYLFFAVPIHPFRFLFPGAVPESSEVPESSDYILIKYRFNIDTTSVEDRLTHCGESSLKS